MKRIPRLVTAIFASALMMSVAWAEGEPSDVEVLNKFPTLSGEELKQVLFTASMPGHISPVGVSWQIHNPFRDRAVAGIVVSIEWNSSASKQPTVLDVFIRTECGPLSSDGGHLAFFNAEEASKASPRMTLKEVRYAALVK